MLWSLKLLVTFVGSRIFSQIFFKSRTAPTAPRRTYWKFIIRFHKWLHWYQEIIKIQKFKTVHLPKIFCWLQSVFRYFCRHFPTIFASFRQYCFLFSFRSVHLRISSSVTGKKKLVSLFTRCSFLEMASVVMNVSRNVLSNSSSTSKSLRRTA